MNLDCWVDNILSLLNLLILVDVQSLYKKLQIANVKYYRCP
jgi:hypothetical protein